MPERPRAAPARAAPAPTAPSRAAGAGRSEAGGGTAQGASGAGALDAWRAAVGRAVLRGLRQPPGRGRVVLALTVDVRGRITGVQVAASSGDGRLDRAAAREAMAVRRVPAAPPGTPPGAYRLRLVVDLS